MPNRVHWRELHSRTDQAQARLAHIAENDCWNGGARALTLADCAKRLRLPLAHEFAQIVSDAYASSVGMAREFLAYECDECGCAHLGVSAARECCANLDAYDLDECECELD